MQRREWLRQMGALAVALGLDARENASEFLRTSPCNDGIAELKKSKPEWRRLLAPEAREVLFEEGTERPFTSPLNNKNRQGTYICVACYLPLAL